MKKISERIFIKINTAVESSLQDILKDISVKYDINIQDLESEFMDTKKKKQNGYNKYNSKRRIEMLEENPKLDFGDMSKIIGEEWRNLSDEEKKQYGKN